MKNRGCINCRWHVSIGLNVVCRHDSNCYTEVTYDPIFGEGKKVCGYEGVNLINAYCMCKNFEDIKFTKRLSQRIKKWLKQQNKS